MPNGRKVDQMAIKYTNIYHCKTLQNLPKLGFWFEKKPSGNPADERAIDRFPPRNFKCNTLNSSFQRLSASDHFSTGGLNLNDTLAAVSV
jgi:hypothetical protein